MELSRPVAVTVFWKGGVDPSVRSDHLAQTVSIGGFQLGELAVLQDLLDDGVLSPQLLQHLRVGGPPCLGLFHRRQAQTLKEHLAQLLGGIDIEGVLSGQIIDPGLDLPIRSGQHLSNCTRAPRSTSTPSPPSRPAQSRGSSICWYSSHSSSSSSRLVRAARRAPMRDGVNRQGGSGDRRIGQRTEGPSSR